jgi:hypothetical protein
MTANTSNRATASAALLLVPPVEPHRLFARGLIVVDDSVLDDEKRLGLHAFIIPADGAQ